MAKLLANFFTKLVGHVNVGDLSYISMLNLRKEVNLNIQTILMTFLRFMRDKKLNWQEY